ncbi:hypothetical protein [Burkholderia sp. Bp8986]|uniref:hypothetical protein n=1 Tax=Burkholderia sp. Bp8986 TaxID=2184550 RepID=UPI000F5B3545|nr:hypothetical protein [Burkholderia sp. Bp8986]
MKFDDGAKTIDYSPYSGGATGTGTQAAPVLASAARHANRCRILLRFSGRRFFRIRELPVIYRIGNLPHIRMTCQRAAGK